MRIAVVGSGIAGLSAAWLLSQRHDVTLYEREPRLGGHSNTLEIDYDGTPIAVDTGFIVYNERTYPNLIKMFRHLGVETVTTDMSFAVSIDGGRLEYEGSLAGFATQPSNLVSPRYWRMLADLVRFYRTAPGLLRTDATAIGPSLGDWLRQGRYGDGFVHDHLLPMAAAIWSCPPAAMMGFPVRSFVQFFVNHGLLEFVDRPRWYTVVGGSRSYVRRLAGGLVGHLRTASPVATVARTAAGVAVTTRDGDTTVFDQVVLGCHGDEALRALADASDDERRILGSFGYQENEAILHRDPRLMPSRRRAWASWNYLSEAGSEDGPRVAVTYWMNRLQHIDRKYPLFVSLNPTVEPDPASVFARMHYDHPVFDTAAIRAQRALPSIQGRGGIWYCGSYCGWGFHEDGLRAGISVARALGVEPPWANDVPAADAMVPIADRAPDLADAAD
jgi:predicted NAD/FAD-binding protein